MATNWEAKFGKGKWVTVRGARVYIQEGKGLGAALQKLAGKKKTIKSPERKIPKLDDSAKKIIKKNEQTIVNAKTSYRNAINSNNLGDSHKAYVALGKAENAQSINRELKGRGDAYDDLVRRTGAADYNNAKKPADSFESWAHNSHEQSIKAGIKTARAAREAAGTNGKLRSPVYADQKTGKLKLASKPLGNGKLSFKNEKDRKGVMANIKHRNEQKIKDAYTKYGNNRARDEESEGAINHALGLKSTNKKIAKQLKPGRGNIPRGNIPEGTDAWLALKSGNAELSNARIKENFKKIAHVDESNKAYQNEVKHNLMDARSVREKAGKIGKMRSDVYKDSPQQVAEKKARANKELKDSIFRQATAKATVNTEAIKKRGDDRKATASANASAELKKLKNTPVKEDENARLKRQIFLEATAAQKPVAQEKVGKKTRKK